MTHCYQKVKVDGEYLPTPSRRGKKVCYNKPKWKTFIEPLLPEDCKDRTFIEFGCNAGLFLKMAKDKGFGKVIGYEPDRTALECAKKYKSSNGCDYELIKAKLGSAYNNRIGCVLRRRARKNIVIEDLPVADVVLFSNVMYFVGPKHLMGIIDKLVDKAVYVIVVNWNKDIVKNWWKSSPSLLTLGKYFKRWQIKKVIEEDRLYSVLYKSPLKRIKIERYLRDKFIQSEIKKGRYWLWNDDKVMEYWRKKGKTSSEIKKCIEYYRGVERDIIENGIKEPVILGENGGILDGLHRIFVADKMGDKTVIARQL